MAFEQLRVVLLQHSGAGAGRRHHVVETLEGRDHLFGDRARGGAVAGIERRLAAAGLRWDIDGAARLLQELDGRKADRRADQVDQASNEQADARTRGLGAPLVGIPSSRVFIHAPNVLSKRGESNGGLGSAMKNAMCIEDLRRIARRNVPRVFIDYMEAGSYSEHTRDANVEDMAKVKLRQRVLVNVSHRSMATT